MHCANRDCTFVIARAIGIPSREPTRCILVKMPKPRKPETGFKCSDCGAILCLSHKSPFFLQSSAGTGPPQRFDGIYGRGGDRVGDEAQAECQGDWVADCSRALVLAMSGGVFPLAMLPDVLGSKTGDLIIARVAPGP